MSARPPLTPAEARRAIIQANAAILTAVTLIGAERETIERFLEEARSVDSILPILDPTLWRDPERQRASAALKPVYEAAIALLAAHAAARRLLEARSSA